MVIRAIKEKKYTLNSKPAKDQKFLVLNHESGVEFIEISQVTLFMFDPSFEYMYLYCSHNTFKIHSDSILVLSTMQVLKHNGFIPVRNFSMVNIKDCIKIEEHNGDFSLHLKHFGMLPGVDMTLIKRYLFSNYRPFAGK
ncbi:MAG: hypothetical protein MH472_12075 [Bacteroidia bacterium]|nr:hypothetical protein [Bacteroidia bacterium]